MDEKLIDQILEARSAAQDAARPDAVAAIHTAGRLTARERIALALDPGAEFVEYGVLAEARPDEPGNPADGLVGGVGEIHGHPVVICSYDESVLAGGQSDRNVRKINRLLYLANTRRWPFICFANGDGARTEDATVGPAIAISPRGRWDFYDGLAEASGWAPTVAVISGRAMDGNAAIAMLSDFVVATADSTIGGHDGPGPDARLFERRVEEYEKRGDLDLVVEDEPAAIAAVRQYLGYWAGEEESGVSSTPADELRAIVPEGRRRPYDMRKVIHAFADDGSVLELRPNWGKSMLTCFARLGGRSIGIFANQPRSPLAGAIDADAADKASRFIELCDAYGFPLVSFIDNPGYMVGPEAERNGIARHHARPLAALHHRSVPLYSVQLRKAYGLGPFAMSGWGSSRVAPDMRLAWPSVESGGMSLEGAAYLVRRREIKEAATPEDALRIRDEYATKMRDQASGVRAGRTYSFDDILMPEETRERIMTLVKRTPRVLPSRKPRPVDPV